MSYQGSLIRFIGRNCIQTREISKAQILQGWCEGYKTCIRPSKCFSVSDHYPGRTAPEALPTATISPASFSRGSPFNFPYLQDAPQRVVAPPSLSTHPVPGAESLQKSLRCGMGGKHEPILQVRQSRFRVGKHLAQHYRVSW